MIRLLLLICASAVLWGADAADDLLESAGRARTRAESDLAGERTRIIEARTKRVAEVGDLARKLADARGQLAGVLAENDRLRPALDDLRQNGTGVEVVVAQQIGRAASLLHQERLPTSLVERAQVVARALALVPDRLAAEITVTLAEEEVQDRSGVPAKVPVMRIGPSRAVACGPSPETRGTLRTENGLALVSGPPLPRAVEAALGDPARVVLDIPGTWAAQLPPPHRSFLEWVKGGRLFIWPILGVGLAGVVLAILRVRALAAVPLRRERLDAVLDWLAGDRTTPTPLALIAVTPLERVVAVGIQSLGMSRSTREAAMDKAVLSEAPALQRGLGIQLLLASISPLLGLLGTVTGMIDLFSVIGAQGSGNARALSGGISEALITTQAGMLVAVPLLVAHALLNRAAEKRMLLLEEAASGILGHEGNRS